MDRIVGTGRPSTTGSIAVALSSIALVACGGSRGSDPWTRVDSAGVEIVVSDPDSPRWTGELDLLLSLGTVAGGGPTDFFGVKDVELIDSAMVAVANAGTEEVRLFSLDGTHLRSFGRGGRGPAEFVRLQMVEEWGDSILTYDGGNDRIGVRDLEGALGRTFRLEWFGGSLFPVDVTPSGHLLAVTARYMTELQGTGRVVDTSLVSLYDLEGALLDSVARLPHNVRFVKQVGDMRTTVTAPLSAVAGLVAVDSGFCHAFGPIAEVRCYDVSGALRRISRIGVTPRAVEDADVQRYWDDLWAELEGPRREVFQRLRVDVTFPEHFPAISALIADDLGRVWARRYRVDEGEEGTWWVLESGGLAGVLTTPAGLEIRDVERGLVAGIWRDELDVEHVRVYRLVLHPS